MGEKVGTSSTSTKTKTTTTVKNDDGSGNDDLIAHSNDDEGHVHIHNHNNYIINDKTFNLDDKTKGFDRIKTIIGIVLTYIDHLKCSHLNYFQDEDGAEYKEEELFPLEEEEAAGDQQQQ